MKPNGINPAQVLACFRKLIWVSKMDQNPKLINIKMINFPFCIQSYAFRDWVWVLIRNLHSGGKTTNGFDIEIPHQMDTSFTFG